MTGNNLFHRLYASFTHAWLLLLKAVALCFERLVILGPVGAIWATIDTDHPVREPVKQLQDMGILGWYRRRMS